MTIIDIITTCHKINAKPNIHLGEVQDVYESKDGQKMTNEKLGVLLVDVPEPRIWDYFYLAVIASHTDIGSTNRLDDMLKYAYRCTQEEAKKYPQFKWVALEDLT